MEPLYSAIVARLGSIVVTGVSVEGVVAVVNFSYVSGSSPRRDGNLAQV